MNKDVQSQPFKSDIALLSTGQACKFLNCHRNTLLRWEKNGLISAIRFGTRGHRKYKKEDLLEILNSHPGSYHNEALLQKQDFLNRILSTSLNGLYIFDFPKGEINFINQQYTNLTGYTLKDIRKLSKKNQFFYLFHPDDQEMVNMYVQAMRNLKDEEIREIVYRFKRKDGQWVWLLSRETLFSRNPDGSVHEYVGSFLDITSQKQAEAEIRHQKAQLEAVFNAVSDGITVFDMQGNLVLLNQAEAKLVGYKNVEEMMQNLAYFVANFKLYTVDKQHEVPVEEWPVSKAMRGESFAYHELWVERIDINKGWYISYSGAPIYDSEGKQAFSVVVSRDITKRKVAEEGLRTSELRLRKFMDANVIGIIFWNIGGTITNANDIYLKTVGYSRKDLRQSKINWIEMTPSEYKEVDKQAVADLYKFGFHTPVQKELIKKDGSRVPVLVGRTFVDETKQDGIGFVLDMSDQMKARDALEKNEEKFRHMANSMPQLVWTAKPDGVVDYYNVKYKEFIGIRKKGKKFVWAPVLHPEDVAKTVEAWNTAVANGTVYEVEHRVKLKRDGYQWFLSRGLPIKNSQGAVIKWYGTATNIHKMKQLEQQKDEFIGIASHELKTPLTTIKAYTQFMQGFFKRKGEDKPMKYLQIMDAQINRLTVLITDLLDVTKIQAGQLQLRLACFDFNQLVREVVAELQLTSIHHVIQTKLADSKMVWGDRNRIGQVLTNFLTNAIKYSPDTKHVTVSTKTTRQDITVCVRDFGIGIPKDQQAKVFERFYQVGGQIMGNHPGLGLGLYISSEIIKRHHGDIWVESQTGKGSRFYFRLPISKNERVIVK